MSKPLLLLALFFLSFSVQAQYNDWTKAEIYLKDGSILKGHARLNMAMAWASHKYSSSMIEDLRYVNFEIKQRRSTKFSPEEVDKIIFDTNNKVNGRRVKRKAIYIPIKKAISKNKKKTRFGFAELIVDGKIRLMQRTVSDPNQRRVYKQTLLIRENGLALAFNYGSLKSFKERASEYFKDCSSLVSKIQSKRYRKKDLVYIVKYYNDNCAK